MDLVRLLAWLHAVAAVLVGVLGALVVVGALLQDEVLAVVGLVSLVAAAVAVLVGVVRWHRGAYRAAALLHAVAGVLFLAAGALAPAAVAIVLFLGDGGIALRMRRAPQP